jgi:hypothetical protein
MVVRTKTRGKQSVPQRQGSHATAFKLLYPEPMRVFLGFVSLLACAATSNISNEAISRVGLLETNTLFTVYGRGFSVAPILGRLGQYKDMDAMAAGTQKWVDEISGVNGGKDIIRGIHLIYALAVPCTDKSDCLSYLGNDIVEKYIVPAAQRGWVVFLDTQLGRSDPVEQVNQMIRHGYLKYENVHVAIDPEFHVLPGHLDPGIPIGHVTASQINAVQEMLDRYVETENLKTKKILIVHQFDSFMIEDKTAIRDFANVELVLDFDGLGTPFLKVDKYNPLTNSRGFPFLRFRGIKVFFPNQWEHYGHFDKPPMTLDQIFGLVAVPGGLRMDAQPNVIIIA